MKSETIRHVLLHGAKYALIAISLAIGWSLNFNSVQAQELEIDWDKARAIHQKAQRGETLTPAEREYYELAKQARNNAATNRQQSRRGSDGQIQSTQGRTSTGLIPLTQMGALERYKSEDGGLYGNGMNSPPPSHLEAALREAKQIQPLDDQGRPSKDGKIVLISSGMSNTTQEFSAFMQAVQRDPDRSSELLLVDGAFGGQSAGAWVKGLHSTPANQRNPWQRLAARLKESDVTPHQVQVAWMKHAQPGPAKLGEFPRHAEDLKRDWATITQELKRRFPNLRIAYLSNRIYAGYANTQLNPEPYAYESAFAVRWLVQDQIKGNPDLNFDPTKGEVLAPVLLWGPYLWADGVDGRDIDDLVWTREDLAKDGTHPSMMGRTKVADQLLRFFKTDRTATPWFLAR